MIRLFDLETGLDELDQFKIKSTVTGNITDGPFMFVGNVILGYTLYELVGNNWTNCKYDKVVLSEFKRKRITFVKYEPSELDYEGEEKMDLLDKTLGMQVYVNKAEGRVVLKTEDGDTYKAKCSVDDEFDIEKGVMLAMLKECYGPRVYGTVEALVSEAIVSEKEKNTKEVKMEIVAGDSYRATNYNDAKKALKLLEDQGFNLCYYTPEELEKAVKIYLTNYGEVYFITYYDKDFQPANHNGCVKVHDIK